MRGTPGVNEKDWKLFRSRIPDWQEAYMDRLNHEYIEPDDEGHVASAGRS